MNLASAPLADKGPAAYPTADGTTVIRTEVDPSLRMTAPVYVDGKGPYDFIIDTGANTSVISTTLASELAAPPGPPAHVHGIAGTFLAPTVNIRKIAIGSVVSSTLVIPSMDVEFLGAPGLIGVDVMKNRVVQLDFHDHQLHIGPSRGRLLGTSDTAPLRSDGGSRIPRSEATSGMVAVAARYRFGQLTVVDADVEGLPVVAFLDSGSETTVGNLALLNGFSRTRPDFAKSWREVQILSATGQTADAKLASLPSLRLGGLKISNVPAAFSDLHAFEIWGLARQRAILVGMDILRHFDKVELDFGGHQVRFYLPRPDRVSA